MRRWASSSARSPACATRIPDDPVCRRAFTAWMKMDISLDPLRPLPEFQRLMLGLDHEFPDEQPNAIPLLQSA